MDLILGQMIPLTPHLFKIHLNILPSTSRSSKWSRPLRFPHINFNVVIISRACYISRTSHGNLTSTSTEHGKYVDYVSD
jgi:hypothetical protein